MPSVEESLNQSQLNAGLKLGIETLSSNQTITFTKYVRVVLPVDGFVFWVKSSILSENAIIAATRIGSFTIDQAPTSTEPLAFRNVLGSPTFVARGSLHYSTSNEQTNEGNYSTNQIIFTSEDEVVDFNAVSSTVLYIGEWQGVRFAFNSRRAFYQQAGIYHYVGSSVTNQMQSQIVDDPLMLDTQNKVLSNSMPLWLAINSANSPLNIPGLVWGGAGTFGGPGVLGAGSVGPPNFVGSFLPLYPAMLTPDNLPLPYATIYIDPKTTTAIQAVPGYDRRLGHWQLVRETVLITVYGDRNFQIMDFFDFVLNYMTLTDDFGLMNTPVPRDEMQPQVEFDVLAQKKTIEFEINYYQQRARDIARQLILEAIPTFTIRDVPVIVGVS